jgi:hypothetical protein
MLNNKAKGQQMQKFFSVSAEDEGFTFNVSTEKMFSTCGDGYWSNVQKDVMVTDIGMFVSTKNEADEGDEAEYYDGDMYVLYEEDTWDNSVDGLIYTDSAFLEQVQEALFKALQQLNIDTATAREVAYSVSYSEQGMQDDGRVSLDAFEFADFMRKFYAENTVLA